MDTTTLFHGSNSNDFTGPVGNYHADLFGGVFASEDETVAASHASTGAIYTAELDNKSILTSDALSYDCDYESVTAAVATETGLSGSDLELIVDATIEDEETPDGVAELLSVEDDAHASWELQRLRGVIAKVLGFAAVEMRDEHGTTFLVLPGIIFNRV